MLAHPVVEANRLVSRDDSRVVFLVRDRITLVDDGDRHDPGCLEFSGGAAEGLRLLWSQGWGLLTAMKQRLRAMVEAAAVRLAAIIFCPHVRNAISVMLAVIGLKMVCA